MTWRTAAAVAAEGTADAANVEAALRGYLGRER